MELCKQCGLNDCPRVMPSGSPNASLVIVGEAPGAEEVMQGKPFVGRSGQLLDSILSSEGFDPSDTYRTNACLCRPPLNRTPTKEEIALCNRRLLQDLSQTTGTILALGAVAQGAVESLRQTRRVVNCWHPAYVLRKPTAIGSFRVSVRQALGEPSTFKWPQVRVPKTYTELKDLLEEVGCGAPVAFDLETDNLNWYDTHTETAAPILMLALCWDPSYSVIVNDELLYDVPEVREYLQKWMSMRCLVGHGCKFDAVFLEYHLGIKTYVEFDTMLAHYVLDESTLHGLKELAGTILGIPDWEEALIKKYLRNKNDSYSKIPFEILAQYAACDVSATLLLRDIFEKQLLATGLYHKPFKMPIMVAANALAKVEQHGMLVDEKYLLSAQLTMNTDAEMLTKELRDMVRRPTLNPNSTQQLAEVLYDQLGFKIKPGRKSSPRSTNHEALDQLKGKHPFIEKLLEYRRVAKMRSSYIDNLLEMRGTDNRVHPTFKIHGTETGRLAVTNPAMQTMPRPSDKYGKMIRRAIIAPPGHKLAICDYSQAELRVFAALSKDPFLMQVYQEGRDLHSEVAAVMFGPDFTKEQRVHVKMFNFSYVYGGTEYSFAQDMGIPVSQARELIRRFNSQMKTAVQWKQDQWKFLREHGYVETAFGRRRRFPLLTTENVDEARKASINMPIQGTASDLTLIAACRAIDEGIHVTMLIHDSIMIEEPDEVVQKAAERVRALMVLTGDEFLPQVPWKTDLDIMQEWYAEEKD